MVRQSLPLLIAYAIVSILTQRLILHAQARAPLVSLTVSILSNRTGEMGHIGFQATFDRSDYAYPLPQTGLSTFGFAGELYVPENASCADNVLGTSVREYTRPNHPNGIAFLPYRSCRATWEWILHQEMQAGRAVGAIIYSMKDDAAHAAERAAIDLTYLHMPVWVVNADTGEYLTNVMKQLYTSDPGLTLPLPPANVMYQNVQDDVRAAMRAAKETLTQSMPWVFITISRSAANVATADRNFFLKAMIGVGITGIVCFFIAMIVRYFDCLCFGCVGQRQLRNQRGVWPYSAGELDGLQERGFGSRSVMAAARRRSDHGRRVNERGTAMPREKRVLKQHELDAMPCKVISLYDLMPEGEKPAPVAPAAPAVPAMPHYGMNLHASISCPQLLPDPHRAEEDKYAEPVVFKLQRVYSIQNKAAVSSGRDLGYVACSPKRPKIESNGWDASALECAICLDEIHVGDVIRTLPCPHIFHSSCIDRWLLYQSSFCPLCKRDTLLEPHVPQSGQ
ncbi:hypothetical protein GGF37_000888 [Kickxella alabastrina]|nr:hypothetical protein GGF37_000888 [Kickxella alabastrina]